MAQYKGHLAGGIVAWLILGLATFGYAPTPAVAGIWLLCALAGALFPDIDIKSKGQKLFYYALIPIYVFLLLQGMFIASVVLTFAAFVPVIVHHRGLLHCWWFLIIMPSSVALAVIQYVPEIQSQILFSLLFFIAGALSHLWLDFGIKKMFH